jgi:hypothetical protein
MGRAGLALIVVAVLAAAGSAAEPAGVNQAIDRGVAYLKTLQRPDGTWPRIEIGATALAGLTLLECQVPADDPAVRKAAQAVRAAAISMRHTYSISLSLLFLDRLGDPADVPLIESLAVRLLAGQNSTGGWTYHCPALSDSENRRLTALLKKRTELVARTEAPEPGRARRTARDLPEAIRDQLRLINEEAARPARAPPQGDDNSNTQFATLALWVARRHGIPIDQAAARLDRRFRMAQNPDGGWGYKSGTLGATERQGSTPPMTCAGLLGLAVAQGVAEEAAPRPGPEAKPDPSAQPRRDPLKDPALRAALLALGTAVGQPAGRTGRPVLILPHDGEHYYFLWSLERVAVAWGLETIGTRDWYAWGAEILVANQQRDGGWEGANAEGGPDTCFALLFLRRANLARDLVVLLRGKVQDPGRAVLKAGGVGGASLTPADGGSAEGEAARLSDDLVAAPAAKQGELLDSYTRGKGAVYTDALAAAIPRLTGAAKARARDALADRLARMTSRTLGDKLQDDSGEVRRAAALACFMKDDRGHVPRLIELLQDPERSVARAAHAALKGFAGQDFGPEADASRDEVGRAVAAWKAWWAKQENR